MLLASTSGNAKAARQLASYEHDWDWILERAEICSLAPLLYANLKKLELDQKLPAQVAQRLRSLSRESYATGINRLLKLKQILSAFAEQQITAVLLKGAALSVGIYDSPGLRPMVDLDLLVHERDLDVCERLLRELGYVPDESYQTAEWYKKHHHHLVPYVSPDSTLSVELHRKLSPPRVDLEISTGKLWERCQTVEIPPITALVLPPELLLLSICSHVAAQRFQTVLRDIVDISAILQAHAASMDWQLLFREIRSPGAARLVYYALWITQRFTGALIPGSVLQNLKMRAGVGPLEDLVLKSLIPRAVVAENSKYPTWVICDLIDGILYPTRIKQLPVHLWEAISKRFNDFSLRARTHQSIAPL